MTQSSVRASGYYPKTPNKPSGRNAKRMAFYAINRRQAKGVTLPFLLDELAPPFGPSYQPELYTKVVMVTQTQEDFERLRKTYEQPGIAS